MKGQLKIVIIAMVMVVFLLPRQVDDLQFQLEEQGVISGDQLESAAENSVQSLTKVTEELEKERLLTKQLRGQLLEV